MRANTASMLAALAAKSDEQDRHIAALEAAASGNDALPPDCDPGGGRRRRLARRHMLALAGLSSAIRWR